MEEKIKKICMLVMDMDGVLTDGHIILANFGGELKFFDVQDGLGLSLWHRVGYKSAVLTANKSAAIVKRSRILKVDKVYQNYHNKLSAYNKIKQEFKLRDEQIAFMGDDLVDLPVLKRVGFSCCVANGTEEVKQSVDYITNKVGGHGAIREVIELILKKQNLWQELIKIYQI